MEGECLALSAEICFQNNPWGCHGRGAAAQALPKAGMS